MKYPFPIIAAILLNGCSSKTPALKPRVGVIAPTPQKTRTLARFKGITVSTSMSAVIKRFGSPDGDVGSGIDIYVYRLSNGSAIQLGSPDGESLICVDYVKANGQRQRLSSR